MLRQRLRSFVGGKQRQDLFAQLLNDFPCRSLRHVDAQCPMVHLGITPFAEQFDQALAAGLEYIATA
ncbi:hypothetical protein D9M71_821570 [compost metagenome]